MDELSYTYNIYVYIYIYIYNIYNMNNIYTYIYLAMIAEASQISKDIFNTWDLGSNTFS